MARHPEIYKTKEWREARKYVMTRSNGLCERCKKKGKMVPGKIVHHIKWLTDDNKNDWSISYNPNNLEYICNDCHENVHERSSDSGLQKFLIPPG
jgi:5-methylcytosine-specific restriction endonuclease McrA